MKRFIAFAFDEDSQGGAMDIVGSSDDLLTAVKIARSTAHGLGSPALWHVLDPQTSTVYHGDQAQEEWLDEASDLTYKCAYFWTGEPA